jgi:hypothetical protein
MAWLILDPKNYGGIDRIDVTSDVHVKVSHVKWTDVTSSYVTPDGLTWLKRINLKKNFYPSSFLKYLLKKPK